MSLIDLWKEFHSEAIQREFPASSRVLFDTIIYQMNAAFWADNLVLSERELIQLTGLKKTTLHDAKRFLASRHIIECKPFKNKTAYSLGEEPLKLLLKGQELIEQQPTTSRPVTDQSPTTSRPLEADSYIRTREDVKTLEISSSSSSNARANSQELDDILEYWEQVRGARLSFEHISEVGNMVAKYGFDFVKAAITEASDANGNHFGLSMKFFRRVLASKLNQAKGAKKFERKHDANWLDYTEPDTDWINAPN